MVKIAAQVISILAMSMNILSYQNKKQKSIGMLFIARNVGFCNVANADDTDLDFCHDIEISFPSVRRMLPAAN